MLIVAHPGMITHTVSEPAMSHDQPPSHSDVHQSMSTPGRLVLVLSIYGRINRRVYILL